MLQHLTSHDPIVSSNMKIAYDGQIFLQRHGGISRYFTELAGHLQRHGVTVKIFAGLHKNAHLTGISTYVSGFPVPHFPEKLNRLLGGLNRAWFCFGDAIWKPNVIHETYFAKAHSLRRSIPVVTTVYDMIHELFPGNFKTGDKVSDAKKRAVKRADHVICISGNTKADLMRLWGVPEKKLSVIHLACESLTLPQVEGGASPAVPSANRQRMLSPSSPFLLYVGQRAGYKNFELFLETVGISPDLKAGFQIIAFGGGPFTGLERSAISALGFKANQVVQITGTDAELAELYRSAAAFVYPSLYEGFGLPPLEAMVQGCPVVASNTSSMPEVIGDAAQFFDPSSGEDLAAAVRLVVGDRGRREELIAAGLRRGGDFSWEKCAAETLQVYQNVR